LSPRKRAIGEQIGADAAPPQASIETTAEKAPPRPELHSFADIVGLAAEKRDLMLKIALEDHCELVRFKPGHIELHLLEDAAKDLANELGRKLKYWTGERWMISLTDERGERPLGEVRREHEARLLAKTKRHPAVASVMRHFPDAEILSVREIANPDNKTKKD
jgi:DNA polymerase-3 subunit gamma/tau